MSDSFPFTKAKWEVVKDKKLLETPIFSLHERNLNPEKDSDNPTFYVLEAPEWINILAITPDAQIVLVEQYRAGTDETTLEIPGGMVDAGETPLEAARRELLEETGFHSDSWSELGRVSSNPAILSNYTHLFLAKNCEQIQEQNTEGNEDIAVHIMDLKRFFELIRSGIVHHAIVVSAVAKYLLCNKQAGG